MLSSAINRVVGFISAIIFCAASSTAVAAPVSEQVMLVGSLYKAFAWQALASSDDVFGKPLAQQENAVLRHYFDHDLATLIVNDHRCAVKTGELCNLDFDPIFASQDPGASDLSIRSVSNGIVVVEFTYPGNREKVRLEYRLVKIEGRWRISDIHYPGMSNTSLKQLLARKLAY